MTRLIDADALLNELHKHFGAGFDEDEWWNSTHVLIAIEWTPTVDAVPVIRCKECKHWDGYFCHNKWWGDGYGNYTPPIKLEDGFCDWSEGKEE